MHITRSASTLQVIRLGDSNELLLQICIALMVRQFSLVPHYKKRFKKCRGHVVLTAASPPLLQQQHARSSGCEAGRLEACSVVKHGDRRMSTIMNYDYYIDLPSHYILLYSAISAHTRPT